MKSAFAIANAFTQRWEKGFVDHPNDPGGVTYNGVSLRFLQGLGLDINGDGKVDAQDIRDLYARKAQAEVDTIFRRAFWDGQDMDYFSACPPLQVVLYDTSVNCGTGRAVKCLQKAVNGLGNAARLTVDGALGPKTRRAVMAAVGQGQGRELALLTLAARRAFHRSLVDGSPHADGRDYRPFGKGWENRCVALGRYLEEFV